MYVSISAVKGLVRRLYRSDAPLTVSGAVMFVCLMAFLVGLAIDPRVIAGAPRWLKPAKFALSIGVYCLTLAWVVGYLPKFRRTRRIVSRVTVGAMMTEMSIIALQAARGTQSHFNVQTPLDALLFGIMGLAIVAQTFISIAVAVALFRQTFDDRALGWALRLGMSLTIAGALFGGLMTQPTGSQLEQMKAGEVVTSGAHTVGGADGGPGVPITGWSKQHGDLRIPHFVALHALQVLPLFALILRRARLSDDRRVRLILALTASYVALVGLVLWRALAGLPLLVLDWGALSLLLTWLLSSAAFVAAALGGTRVKRLPVASVA
jgi:hypothetical protein